jgi:tryptophan synthase alpha chain
MKSGRIERMAANMADRGCKAFTAYFMAGDPDPEMSFRCIQAAIDAGASQIELGVPYSDPAADGPVIRRAGTRALAAGIRMADVFDLAGRIRRGNETLPIALMLYFNLVFRYGVDRFFQDCARTGIDACILPDLPLEEQEEVRNPALLNDIRLIQLVSPNSGAGIPEICRRAEGFLYCVSSLGTTGERFGKPAGLDGFLDRIALYTSVPRFVGFGISRPEQATAMSRHAEGVIVGSALVRLVLESPDPVGAVGEYVASMCRQLCAPEKSVEVSL